MAYIGRLVLYTGATWEAHIALYMCSNVTDYTLHIYVTYMHSFISLTD